MPRYRATAADVRMGVGVHPPERDAAGPFWWLQRTGRLTFDPAPVARWLEFRVLSEFRDLSQQLSIAFDEGAASTAPLPLVHGWSAMSVAVPAGVRSATIAVNKIYPREYYPADGRTLSVRLRDVRLHADAERHAHLVRQYDNACLNQREIADGRVVLTSTPPHLGIDLHGACNVKPPCVYCEWDFSKAQEGENVDAPFTRETLRAWGPFFDNSTELINCSIGEPFMMRNLNELFDVFAHTGKMLEMTTNGQILTEHNVRRLLGLGIDLYVSLDAATPETYAKLRNDTFDRILVNLRRLVAAKGGRGNPPFLNLVFMPMRVNLHELEPFVELAADLGVDRLILRPLNYSDSITLDWQRAGYHFDYARELLPFAELVRASGRAARLAERLGVELSDQMNFGGAMRAQFAREFAAGERQADAWLARRAAQSPAPPPVPETPPAGVGPVAPAPATPDAAAAPSDPPATVAGGTPVLPSLGAERRVACLEPWKSLYILRRGVLPCCYGHGPIAPMDQHAEAWNSETMQGIRRELLAGRFHKYCLVSTACPVVRKSEQAGTLGTRVAARLWLRHVYVRLDRRLGGRLIRWGVQPGRRVLGWLSRPGRRALRVLFRRSPSA